ncbi:5-aminolevulinic acid synthase [Plasmodium falciparum UGT5.1]|uniref:5-aminolevulinate synthase n=9 Tax=Plasmodium falciparum TaxID=5833 RepID=Q8I4X1_PLAF7|nr:delta-aminolevulinic acid synthetase [Plasmodium falciparum 3D7]AAC37294.1 delta-aminolevulinic acid synthetase [Plasmodium falciparum]ETW17356.1 5-aminolevulinic acid synthase [Plasmodium falciparum Vietnam Oak-Knoll (FVO)]ETW41304.1 5-aminolevulinic acid synthase [Plasmodium falciparum NF135/5.C10]ETW47978.1 5-aminolevulinic acid synthase [Plasmodium falciparum MaliPS096_E11]EWC75103.1 5-aminolevulinic acid synthase [Plasmodium falciparum UGT5.1]EWC87197.1 5-aminolevulinic acid synthase |eukprot:XP_001350846.1 delta-aminolevulinic acid synthetase [Plasmodium falciparum 3D7]
MRKKRTLKVSINEIKKYCPFVKNIQFLYNTNEKKNNLVLSVMSDLCPVGKAINEKHFIIIDNKSKINIIKILKQANMQSKVLVQCIKNKNIEKENMSNDDLLKSGKRNNNVLFYDILEKNKNDHSFQINDNTIQKNNIIYKYINSLDEYKLFKNNCNNNLKDLLNKLYTDKRYRIFTILNKYRINYPNVYIENNKLMLPSFYEFYQKYGYKPCIGNIRYQLSASFEDNNKNICSFSHKNKENYLFNFWNLHIDNVSNEKTVVWCSNDYLCLSNNEKIIEVGIETLKKIGNSSGGTRNISGSLLNHTHLEYIIAKWYNKESSLLFTSGYIANVGALETLGKLLNLIYISDEMNHASIINGIRESRCEKFIFKHNDMNDLERILYNLRINKQYENRKIMIVFESIYSMSGHISNIEYIVQLAKKYNALTYVDEVHAVGLYGNKGSGYLEELHLCNHIDIINGTLSKAIGSLGGFICANKYYIDVIRSYSSHFIFTTSLTPVNINTSAEAIHIIQNDMSLRKKLTQVVNKTKQKLQERGIQVLHNNSHIVVLMINSAEKCKQICDDLLKEYNIYIQPINYPTVPMGMERIRITPSPFHTDEQIFKLVNSLYTLFKKYQVNMFDKKNKHTLMKL